MIIDKENLLDEDLALTAVGVVKSTNAIDLGADDAKIQQFVERGGILFCQVTETFVGVGASLQVAVRVSSSAAKTGGTTLRKSQEIPVATLKAGYKFRIGPSLPAHVSKQYLFGVYEVLDAAFSAGKITVGLALDEQTSGMEPL